MFRKNYVNFLKRISILEKESQENHNKIELLLEKENLLLKMVEAAYADSEKNKVLVNESGMYLTRVNGYRSFVSRIDKATKFSKKEAELLRMEFHEKLKIETVE